jgi:hypothetical protein
MIRLISQLTLVTFCMLTIFILLIALTVRIV